MPPTFDQPWNYIYLRLVCHDAFITDAILLLIRPLGRIPWVLNDSAAEVVR